MNNFCFRVLLDYLDVKVNVDNLESLSKNLDRPEYLVFPDQKVQQVNKVLQDLLVDPDHQEHLAPLVITELLEKMAKKVLMEFKVLKDIPD